MPQPTPGPSTPTAPALALGSSGGDSLACSPSTGPISGAEWWRFRCLHWKGAKTDKTAGVHGAVMPPMDDLQNL